MKSDIGAGGDTCILYLSKRTSSHKYNVFPTAVIRQVGTKWCLKTAAHLMQDTSVLAQF